MVVPKSPDDRTPVRVTVDGPRTRGSALRARLSPVLYRYDGKGAGHASATLSRWMRAVQYCGIITARGASASSGKLTICPFHAGRGAVLLSACQWPSANPICAVAASSLPRARRFESCDDRRGENQTKLFLRAKPSCAASWVVNRDRGPWLSGVFPSCGVLTITIWGLSSRN